MVEIGKYLSIKGRIKYELKLNSLWDAKHKVDFSCYIRTDGKGYLPYYTSKDTSLPDTLGDCHLQTI